MTRGAREVSGVTALALLLTMVIAWPVLQAPSDRLFGMPVAGHHHDPFTFMRQIEGPVRAGMYLQPATDIPAAMVERAAGPVAAYNWVVLATFPLAALAAFLLARYLAVGSVWAAIAAIAFAFSPFHLSHAAYHPHIAQTQWVPLYFLALWRCLDNPTRGALALLALAVAGVSLSSFYGGLIAAVITPAAVGAYWCFPGRGRPAPVRGLVTTAACLALMAAAGLAYIRAFAPGVLTNPAATATAPDDIVRYGARWWSYLVPPLEHPVAGPLVGRTWHAAGVDAGLLEQQVALGWGMLALAFVAVAAWLVRDRTSSSRVPLLAAVALAAFACSLTAGVPMLLHDALPMFRSYARFGVVVQLMTVLLAAMGAQRLWQSGRPYGRAVCMTLLALAAAEYAVWPPSMSRQVLPTGAHRWIARHPDRVRALDCAPQDVGSVSTQWLTQYRIANDVEPFLDCLEPNLPEKLAAAGYTHLIVRRTTPHGQWFAAGRRSSGLQAAAHFDDSDVYSVAALAPAVHTVSMTGFHPRERDATWTWRWMEREGSWTIANRSGAEIDASVDVEMLAFQGPLELTVRLDGAEMQRLFVDAERGMRRLGPFSLTPGDHTLSFHAGRRPAVRAGGAGDVDPRPLSFRIGSWRWIAPARP